MVFCVKFAWVNFFSGLFFVVHVLILRCLRCNLCLDLVISVPINYRNRQSIKVDSGLNVFIEEEKVTCDIKFMIYHFSVY